MEHGARGRPCVVVRRMEDWAIGCRDFQIADCYNGETGGPKVGNILNNDPFEVGINRFFKSEFPIERFAVFGAM
jgi:hypothetical protein